jgi:hypothetical protein
MGKFSFGALPLAGIFCMTFSSLALADDLAVVTTCRDQAYASAEAWSARYVIRAAETDKPKQGQYVAIVYGKKYFAPLKHADDGDLHGLPVGERVLKRNRIYREEFARCLGIIDVDLFVNTEPLTDDVPTLTGAIQSSEGEARALTGSIGSSNY